MVFSGNGAVLYKQELLDALGDRAHIPDEMQLVASVRQIARMGLEKFEQGGVTNKIVPQYLKTQSFKKKL